MENKLKKGEYVRIKGWVTMYSPYKKVNGVWSGGSSSTQKNPLIMLGRCKHKPKKVGWFKQIFGEKRVYCKGREICSNCGYIIKFGKEISHSNRKIK